MREGKMYKLDLQALLAKNPQVNLEDFGKFEPISNANDLGAASVSPASPYSGPRLIRDIYGRWDFPCVLQGERAGRS